MTKEIKTYRKNIILLVVFFLLTLILILTFVFLMFIILYYVYKKDEVETRSYPHIHTDIDMKTNTTSYGFATLTEQLKDDEFISYMNEETSTFSIISASGKEEYICHGACVCNQYSKRREVVTVLIGAIVVFGIGGYFAEKLAGNYFKKKCEEESDLECDEMLTGADVDCQKLLDQDYPPVPELEGLIEDEELYELTKENEVDSDSKYNCLGYCIPKEGLEEEESNGDQCHEKEIEGSVESEKGDACKAAEKFKEEHMDEFCESDFKELYPDGESPVPKCKSGNEKGAEGCQRNIVCAPETH